MKRIYNRKDFLAFLGKAGIGTAIAPSLLMRCNFKDTSKIAPSLLDKKLYRFDDFLLESLVPSDKDDLLLANGLDYHILLKWQDRISSEDYFGFNCDFTCFIPFNEEDPTDGLLWVNHEYINPLFVSGYDKRGKFSKTHEQVDKEMYNVGGSIVRIRQENGKWCLIFDDPLNRRITAKTSIPFNWDTPIAGSHIAIGTLANCSGGITPWNTFLTCEAVSYTHLTLPTTSRV